MAAAGVTERLVDGKAGALLLTASALVALWFALYGGFVFFADAHVYFAYADRLMHLLVGDYHFAPGYPFLIVLSGFPVTGSLVPLFVMQVVFAALTPWLAFKTFARVNRRIGIVAGFVCLVSLTPFFFQNTFYHDGPSLFFGFLSITFASSFFATRRPSYMYLSIASATFSYFIQPAVIGFVIGCAGAFALYAFFDHRQFKHAAAAFCIFIAAVVGFSEYQKWASGWTLSSSHIGRRMFFDEYLQGSPYGEFEGPAADKLKRDLITFFEGSSYHYVQEFFSAALHGEEYQDLFGQYEGRPADLVDRIFDRPNMIYFQLLWMVPQWPGGVADDVYLRASFGYLFYHPFTVLGYVEKNFVDFALGPPWSCSGDKIFPACIRAAPVFFYPTASRQVAVAPGSMRPEAIRFLNSRVVSQNALMGAANAAWQWIYYVFRPFLLAAMLIGWGASFVGRTRERWTLGAIVAAYLGNLLLFSLFAEPEYRYQITGVAITAFAAGPGIYAVAAWLGRALAATCSRKAVEA